MVTDTDIECKVRLFSIPDEAHKEATGEILLVYHMWVISPSGNCVQVVEPWSNLATELMERVDKEYLSLERVPKNASPVFLNQFTTPGCEVPVMFSKKEMQAILDVGSIIGKPSPPR
jgi:hypothetical protein